VGGSGRPESPAPAWMTRTGLMKKTISAIAFGGLIAGMVFAAVPAFAQSNGNEIKGVVELFTSQGCSSCPPADKLLGEYAKRKDLLALSYNINYWDYLGWKDTLATADNTQRQRNYADAQGAGVYTPQWIFDGRANVVGSDKQKIDAALTKYGNGLPVHLSLSATGDAITVSINAAAPSAKAEMPHATLWLVMYDRSISVPIRSGENHGETITYSNVVRKLRPIAMWKGEAMSVDLPKSEIKHADVNRCAVLLQAETKDGLPGPILGAATIDMTGT